MFAPGHLGELTRIVSFDLVDAALETSGAVGLRVRLLPSRVVVYLLLAGALFSGIGYRQVWARLCAGLPSGSLACPGSSALSQALRRVGVKPLAALFDLVAGPDAGAVRWRGLLVCAIDGTSVFVPDSPANVAAYGRHGGGHARAGYPMLRMLAVVACGSRTVVDVVFGPLRIAETAYAPRFLGCLRPGMLLLADRNFAVTALIERISDTGAELLIRAKLNRCVPAIARLGDGSWLTRAGAVTVRVIDAEIAVSCAGGPRRVERYRLITTLTDDKRYPARELVDLYHQRWEIETSYFELKSTILGGRVLRARTPAGVTQEVYALLITYQALRTAIADTALAAPGLRPDRGSFTIAVHTARDQLILAAGVLATTTIDLIGAIGRAVLSSPLPPRRQRSSPRVVKRAISKHRAKGDIDRNIYKTQISVHILPG
ncbi:IS4 family transposase (plasmid) [Nocardia sp. NBC_01377]|uniref:IS4 family transposase n=1 Tax=Nocardia sp. NBC_01377 TaxID=2903595 RepID=UPI002F90A9C7